MNKKSVGSKEAAEKLVKNIRRRTSRKYSAEEKIRIVLAGLRGEESIAALCRREGVAESLYYGAVRQTSPNISIHLTPISMRSLKSATRLERRHGLV